MKYPALALVLIAILAIFGLTWLSSDDEPPTGIERPAQLDSPAELDVPPSGTELLPSESEGAVSTERTARPAVVAAGQLDPEQTVWLSGRVELPASCIEDETLEVFALETERRYAALARALDREDTDEPGVAGLLARVPVSLTGTFELPLDRELERAWLLLRGRFLYLSEAVPVGTDDPGQEIVLTPTAGALVQGRVRPPAGVELAPGELGGLEIRFRTEGELANAVDFSSDPVSWSTRVETGEDGSFELRAAPAAVDYDITVEHPRFAALRETTGGFEACSVRHMELALRRGGSVNGVVVDQDGAPVADATVKAALPGKWFGFDDHAVRSASSAADGSFELVGVPSGHLVLRGEGRGYLESKRVKVEVADGDRIEGLTVALSSGKAISGTLTWPDGRAASGVRVRAEFDKAHMAGAGAFNALRGGSGEGESGPDGRFEVAGLGNGPFMLSAKHWASLDGTPKDPDAAEDQDWPGADGEGAEGHDPSWILYQARQDGLSPGVEDVPLVLHPPLGLWGRVVDQDEAPVTRFEVRAARVSEGVFGEFSDTSRSQEFVSEDGAFLLEGLIEGTWKVTVQGDEYVTLEASVVSLPADTQGDPVLVRVLRTARVAGVVVAPDGNPVSGAEVSIDTGSPAWQVAMSGQEPVKTRSTDDGTFELVGVPPQRIGLLARAKGYARSAAVTLELAPGEAATEVVLSLTEGGTLTGEVFDDAGEPAVGRMIVLNQMKTFDNRVTTADREGHFRIEHLEPGTWQVIAMDRSADFTASEESFDVGSMMDSMEISQADITDGETTHVVLGAPPADPVRVTGKVTLGGEPYRGAMVAFFPEGSKLYERMQMATVDADGGYALTLDGAGNYVVSISRLPGAAGQQNTIEFAQEVPERSEFEADFELPLGRISGRVLGPDGGPASGARVTLTSADGARSDQLFGGQYTEIPTEADGTYDIVGLRPGTYRLAAGGAPILGLGGGARFGRVVHDAIRLGEDTWLENVDFRLPAPGSIAAVVRGLDGDPVEGADIFVRDANGTVVEPFSFVTTDSTGKGLVAGLAPGEYTVSARLDDAACGPSGIVRVAEGETRGVELRLEEGAVLWIKLLGGDGEPTKASVRVLDEDDREMGAMFGMQDLQKLYLEGGFSPSEHRLGPLPPGKYRVIAEGEGIRANKPVTIRGGGERKLTVRLK